MRNYWIFQFGGWGGMFLIEMLNYGLNVRWNYDWTFVAYFTAYPVFGILTSHLLKTLFIRYRVFHLPFKQVITIALSSLVLWTMCMAILVQTPELFFDLEAFYRNIHWLSFVVNVVNLFRYTIVWIAIYFFYKVFERLKEIEIEKMQLENIKKDNELSILKMQLNPHFLFNTLNSIKALVQIDPKLARSGIVKLSEILRFSLSISTRDTVSLQEEIEKVKEYLDIEKLRFGDRFYYQIQCEDSLNDKTIPIGVLLTLAENGIKHGASKVAADAQFLMHISSNQNGINIETKNTGKLNQSSNLGLGLQFIRKRMLTQWNKVDIRLFEESGSVIVSIQVV